ncbi:putative virion structural protein [Vibrio phage pVa-21]|nr:putative virion structural protein [Vibrio phage pVa-21]
MAVVAFTQRQAYMENMFEECMLSVAIQPSEYSEGVLVGHEDITVKLIERPYEGGTPHVKMFRGILVDVKDEQMEANRADISETGLQDAMSISIITFQLISEAAYDLRLREVAGGQTIFANATAHDVLRYFLVKTRLYDRYSNKESVATINIDELKSDRVYREIKLPEGHPYLGIADYLQDNYGIFPQGMGCFLKGQAWYVFAPFGLSKASTDVRRLILFNAPSARNRSLERNFKVEGNSITVIATGMSKHTKTSDADALNGGTGVRYASLSAIDGAVSTADPATDPLRTPQDYMTEYRSSNYASPYNKTTTAKERFTDNPLKAASELAARGGDLITVTWENGVLDPLVPGMPVKFYYGKAGKVELREGTLINAERLSTIPLSGIIEPRHQSMVQLTVWLKR